MLRELDCSWRLHCVSRLLPFLPISGLEHWLHEPLLTTVDLQTQNNLQSDAVNKRKLTITWEHVQDLQVKIFDKNGGEVKFSSECLGPMLHVKFAQFVNAQVELHYKGEKFASIPWEHPLYGLPNAKPSIIRDPILVYKWSKREDQRRMERLNLEYCKLLGTETREDWLHHIVCDKAIGMLRALVLHKLGAKIGDAEEAANVLKSGEFKDHFSTHWLQMAAIHQHLHDDNDWRWAAKFVVPPQMTKEL